MNSEQVEIFLCVARFLSFTAAAAELHTTQPTVSRQISLLEKEWGFSLFARNKKEVRLTPGGRIMLQKCREAQTAIASGIKEAMDIENGISGTVRIGCLESMDSSVHIEPRAAEFIKKYPSIRMSIVKRSFSELRSKLEAGELDVIFTLDFELNNLKNIEHEALCPVCCGILMNASHPFARKSFISPEEWKDETFILPDEEDSPGRQSELKRVMEGMRISYRNVLFVPNQESMLMNVLAGKGVALMDTSVLSVNDKGLYSFYPLDEAKVPLSVVYAWKKENTNPALILFLNSMFQNG
ncbi:MAG: LysR family transcriptional regulator [Clostridiales bacterium]|nr:LysR family transcriptional regulator [Clostridiales bacterium]